MNREDILQIMTLALIFPAFAGCGWVKIGDSMSLNDVRSKYTESSDWTFDGTDAQVVYVQNTNGSIRLESSDNNQVVIRARKEVRARNKRIGQAFSQEMKIHVEHRHQKVWTYDEYKRQPEKVRPSVHYTIEIPDGTHVVLRTANGPIHIDLQKHEGQIYAYTGNGELKASVMQVLQPMGFSSGNGPIDVKLPTDFSGQLDATTGSGRIISVFPIRVAQKVRRVFGLSFPAFWIGRATKRLVGEVGEEGEITVTLHTSNGHIHLRKQ